MARCAAVGLAPKALDSIPSLGQRPRLSRSRRSALKARFTFPLVECKRPMNRASSARFVGNQIPGAIPRAKGDIAPSALNRYPPSSPTSLRSVLAFAQARVERGRQSQRRCPRSAAPARDQHDGSPRLTQIHSMEYENESATATS